MRSLPLFMLLAPFLAIAGLGTTAGLGACSSGSGGGSAGTGASGGGGHLSTTSGSPDAGGSDAGPIQAPDDTWTWVDVPGSMCASGTQTGFAVNPHAGATDLVIYMEGGGECYDATTCWGPTPKANNLTGYDGGTFASPNNLQLKYPALKRSSTGSPFAAMDMAYIPYCTGDMHAGTMEVDLTLDGGATMPTYFVGANDLELFLARLVPTFPGVTRVVLLGTSAGGFGTYLTFDRVAGAFGPGVRVDIIDDSGPPLTKPKATDNQALLDTWHFVPPAGCTSPCNSFLAVMTSTRAAQPMSRLGFLSFSWDTTIGPDFGYTATTYPPMIESLFPMHFGSDPNVQTYIVTSTSGHVVESDTTTPGLESDYFQWMTDMLSGSTSWASKTFN